MDIKPHRFENNAWTTPSEPVERPPTPTTMRFVTWNVWFGSAAWKSRFAALLEQIQQCDADVIALQEMTHNTLDLLVKSDWVRRDYWISDVRGITFRSYGVVLLSRLPIASMRLVDLQSAMDRKVLSIDLCSELRTVRVAAVHLESTKERAIFRQRQLNAIFPQLDSADDAVLMGDFNLCSTWPEENKHLDDRYIDMWPALREDPGWTVDTDRNQMTFDAKKKEKSVRFDRVLLRTRGDYWRPQSIKLLGDEPINEGYPVIHPSDHFGLSATIEH